MLSNVPIELNASLDEPAAAGCACSQPCHQALMGTALKASMDWRQLQQMGMQIYSNSSIDSQNSCSLDACSDDVSDCDSQLHKLKLHLQQQQQQQQQQQRAVELSATSLIQDCQGIVSGLDLDTLLRLDGPLDECRAASLVVLPLLEVLKRRHGQGIVHGDIQPSCITIDGSGALTLANTGSAAADSAGSLDDPVVSPYTAPELREYAQDARLARGLPAVDIYSTGILTCEILLGKLPRSLAEGCVNLADLELPNSLSPEARSFIFSALCQDPRLRPTARQLLKHSWLAPYAPQLAGSKLSKRSFRAPTAPDLSTLLRLTKQPLREPLVFRCSNKTSRAPSRTCSGNLLFKPAPPKSSPLDSISAALSAPFRRASKNRVKPSPSSESLASLGEASAAGSDVTTDTKPHDSAVSACTARMSGTEGRRSSGATAFHEGVPAKRPSVRYAEAAASTVESGATRVTAPKDCGATQRPRSPQETQSTAHGTFGSARAFAQVSGAFSSTDEYVSPAAKLRQAVAARNKLNNMPSTTSADQLPKLPAGFQPAAAAELLDYQAGEAAVRRRASAGLDLLASARPRSSRALPRRSDSRLLNCTLSPARSASPASPGAGRAASPQSSRSSYEQVPGTASMHMSLQGSPSGAPQRGRGRGTAIAQSEGGAPSALSSPSAVRTLVIPAGLGGSPNGRRPPQPLGKAGNWPVLLATLSARRDALTSLATLGTSSAARSLRSISPLVATQNAAPLRRSGDRSLQPAPEADLP